MATDAEKAAFKRRTGEDWDSANPLDPVVPAPPMPVPNNPQLTAATTVDPAAQSTPTQRPWANRFEAPTTYGPTPPASDFTDPGLFGSNKLVAQLQRAPSFARTPYSHDWDQWLLSLPFEKGDDSYNQTLGSERRAAIARENQRGQDTSQMAAFPPAAPLDPTTAARMRQDGVSAQQDAADIKGLKQSARAGAVQAKYGQLPYITNVFGEEVTAQDAMASTGGQSSKAPTSQSAGVAAGDEAVDDTTGLTPTSGSSDAAISASKPATKKALESSGKVVWMGPAEKKFGGVSYVTDQYMTYNDALLLPTRTWTTDQIVAFQDATGAPITGVVDEATQTKWAAAVKLSNRYTMAGRHMDPMAAASTVAAATKRSSRSGSGGSGATFVPTDQAHLLLNQTLQKMAGREATGSEFSSFLAGIKGAAGSDDFDATQYAQDWVKGHLGQQVGSYQAGTDYYNVVQQLIGGA